MESGKNKWAKQSVQMSYIIIILVLFASCTQKKSKQEFPNRFTIIKNQPKFGAYQVAPFKGKLASPNFMDNPFATDIEYVEFIKNGCQETPINFAGHYSVFFSTCGMECEHIFVVDRINGTIFYDISLNSGSFGYKFQKDSRLMITSADLLIDTTKLLYQKSWRMPEFYVWEKDDFVKLNG